jgi:hypothetical protein
MKLRWGALCFVLVLSALMPRVLTAQGNPTTPGRDRKLGVLKQNYPNPFNPETRIPFTIGDEKCEDPGRLHKVSLRIFNILSQLVAIPVLQGGTSSVAPGTRIANLPLGCGDYVAYWNGKFMDSTREAASGVYLYELNIDGQSLVKRMLITK